MKMLIAQERIFSAFLLNLVSWYTCIKYLMEVHHEYI